MSEPESLATDEGLEKHLRRHAYDRLLMLSDGIFAIAITLAALEIKIPEGKLSPAALAHEMLLPVLGYLVSFGVIAVFWVSHRNLFARLRSVDRGVTWLTLAMLCLISLIPAVLHAVYTPGGGETRFRLYAVTMIACGVANAAMWIYCAARPRLMAPEVTWADRWTRATGTLAMPLIFLPMLFAPIDRFGSTVLPVALAMIVVRRKLLPWLFGRMAR
jgi:uncharacterized membrane protein